MSLEIGFEFSKAYTIPSYLLLFVLYVLYELVYSQLLLLQHACLPATTIFTMLIMDSPSKINQAQQVNAF